jgi:hypothetical protein
MGKPTRYFLKPERPIGSHPSSVVDWGWEVKAQGSRGARRTRFSERYPARGAILDLG